MGDTGDCDDTKLAECDLVLKGGLASGLIYSSAVPELSKSYRFRSIGGASAGAVGAVFAAAAEYRRQTTGCSAGFDRMHRVGLVLRGKPGDFSRFFLPEMLRRPLSRENQRLFRELL